MSYTLQMLISIKIRSVSPNSRSWESWLKLLRELSDLDLKIAFLLTDSYDVGQRPLRPHCGKSTTRNETGKSNNKDPKKPNVGSDNPFPLGFNFSSAVTWCTWAYLQATKGRDCYYYSRDAYPAITIMHENSVVVMKVCKGIAVAYR